MSETVIRIGDDGKVIVEQDFSGLKSYKQITPDTLAKCINQSMLRGAVHSGLLPPNCLSFSAYDDGSKDVVLLHTETWADISYFGTEYKNFPLPKLVFGFRLTAEGRVASCKLGIVEDMDRLKPDTKMYHYPLSNVSGFSLCTGNNTFPKCESLHTLASLPYYILSMPNNNDHFNPAMNKAGLEMRELLEVLLSRTYRFSSDNKAFWPRMSSYSIFAYCLDVTSDQGVRLDWYMEAEGNAKGWKVEACYILEQMQDAAAISDFTRTEQDDGTVCYFFRNTTIRARESNEDGKLHLEPVSGDQTACGERIDLPIDRVYGYYTLLERHLNERKGNRK